MSLPQVWLIPILKLLPVNMCINKMPTYLRDVQIHNISLSVGLEFCLLRPKQGCVWRCIWQTHLFMINCPQPSSHMAMYIFPSLLQRIPVFQLTVKFPPQKKYHFENEFFSNIANFFYCIKDTVTPQILLLRYKLLYRQRTFQLISYRHFL